MISIQSEIGSISFPDMAIELFGQPRELIGYCIYQNGRLVSREAHPLDKYAIRLDVEIDRGVSKQEAEEHIKLAVARYLKEVACRNGGPGFKAFQSTLERWGLQSLTEAGAEVPAPAVCSMSFDPMIGYSAFTRGLMMTGRHRPLTKSDFEVDCSPLFRFEPLPESEGGADFKGHLYLSRSDTALMVNDAVLSSDHWVVPHLNNLNDVEVEITGGRRAKSPAPELLTECRVILCDQYAVYLKGHRPLAVPDFPLRTTLNGRDALLLTPEQPGDAESIALQFLSVDDLDADDLQCFNDTVDVINQWLVKVRRADQLFTVIK